METKFPKFAGKYASPGFIPGSVPGLKPATPYRRETPHYPSLTSTGPASTAKRDNPRYTGTACLGVAVMHKSNLVPVFTQDQAIDTATMRRG